MRKKNTTHETFFHSPLLLNHIYTFAHVCACRITAQRRNCVFKAAFRNIPKVVDPRLLAWNRKFQIGFESALVDVENACRRVFTLSKTVERRQ